MKRIELTENEIFTVAEIRLLIRCATALASDEALEVDEKRVEESIKEAVDENPLIDLMQKARPDAFASAKERFLSLKRAEAAAEQRQWETIRIKLHLIASLL